MIEKQETIEDIVSEMRIGDLCAGDTAARSMYINDFLTSYADRIEAAHKREIADEKRISDAVVKSLRDKKLEMAGELAAKDKEIAKLHELVKELVGCFENWIEKYPPSEWSQMGQSWQLIEETVARAKEGGAK